MNLRHVYEWLRGQGFNVLLCRVERGDFGSKAPIGSWSAGELYKPTARAWREANALAITGKYYANPDYFPEILDIDHLEKADEVLRQVFGGWRQALCGQPYSFCVQTGPRPSKQWLCGGDTCRNLQTGEERQAGELQRGLAVVVRVPSGCRRPGGTIRARAMAGIELMYNNYQLVYGLHPSGLTYRFVQWREGRWEPVPLPGAGVVISCELQARLLEALSQGAPSEDEESPEALAAERGEEAKDLPPPVRPLPPDVAARMLEALKKMWPVTSPEGKHFHNDLLFALASALRRMGYAKEPLMQLVVEPLLQWAVAEGHDRPSSAHHHRHSVVEWVYKPRPGNLWGIWRLRETVEAVCQAARWSEEQCRPLVQALTAFLPQTEEEERQERRKAKAWRAWQLLQADIVALYQDEGTKEVYAAVRLPNGLIHNIRVGSEEGGSRPYKQWLAARLTELGISPTRNTLDELTVLSVGWARLKGVRRRLYLLAHASDARIEVYLGEGRTAVVEPGRWYVRRHEQEPPAFRFVDAVQVPLPDPVPVEDPLAELRWLLPPNLDTPPEAAEPVLIVWTVLAPLEDVVRPILVLSGLKDAGKSVATAKILGMWGVSGMRTAKWRDLADFAAHMANVPIVALDNVYFLPEQYQEDLAAVVTGADISGREYYTSREYWTLRVKRAVVVNTLNPNVVGGREDLADRSLIVRLHYIPPERRVAAEAVEAELESRRPRLLGAAMEALARGLRLLPQVREELEGRPDMPRFKQWVLLGEAVARGLGFAPMQFYEAVQRLRMEAVEDVVADNDLVKWLLKLLEEQAVYICVRNPEAMPQCESRPEAYSERDVAEVFQREAGEVGFVVLRDGIAATAASLSRWLLDRAKDWYKMEGGKEPPKSWLNRVEKVLEPRALGQQLRRLEAVLRPMGVVIQFIRVGGFARQRLIVVRLTPHYRPRSEDIEDGS